LNVSVGRGSAGADVAPGSALIQVHCNLRFHGPVRYLLVVTIIHCGKGAAVTYYASNSQSHVGAIAAADVVLWEVEIVERERMSTPEEDVVAIEGRAIEGVAQKVPDGVGQRPCGEE
jgi:hypothetical protein